jgi:hypothetical protein
MRAITVRQPWAHAIVYRGKGIENRTRNLAGSYRGPVAIHAGLAPDTAAEARWPLADLIPSSSWQVRGAFIGIADLVDVHVARAAECDADDNVIPMCCHSEWAQYPWYDAAPITHLVLENARALTVPIQYRGRLGLWTPPADVAEMLVAA